MVEFLQDCLMCPLHVSNPPCDAGQNLGSRACWSLSPAPFGPIPAFPEPLGSGSQCPPLPVLPRDSRSHFLVATSQLLETSSPWRCLWPCSLQLSLLPRPHSGSLSSALSRFLPASFHPMRVYTAGRGHHWPPFTTPRSHGLRPRSFCLTPRRPLHFPPSPFCCSLAHPLSPQPARLAPSMPGLLISP